MITNAIELLLEAGASDTGASNTAASNTGRASDTGRARDTASDTARDTASDTASNTASDTASDTTTRDTASDTAASDTPSDTAASETASDTGSETASPQTKKLRLLSNNERSAVVHFLLQNLRSSHGEDKVLARGAQKAAAVVFQTSPKTISRIWKRYKETCDPINCPAGNVSNRRNRCGRKQMHLEDLDALVRRVPMKDRGDLRTLSAVTGIPKSSLHRLVRRGDMRKHNGTTKPLLTAKNKLKRVEWILEHIDDNGRFDDWFKWIHIDEKWFYLKRTKQTTYLLPGEAEPKSTSKSKNHMTKVMFLCATARPRWDTNNCAWFDGKIGIWPFVVKEPAKRSSVNRPKGTLVTKPQNVDGEVYKRMLLEKVLPAIYEKWPRGSSTPEIFIQEDNAKPHKATIREEVKAAAASKGWNITVKTQPPNSPDMNVLDLGFFNSIQSLQYKKRSKDIDHLIANVEEAFDECKRETLNNVFLSLQACMEASLGVDGDNNYKLPHMGKASLMREGTLPISIICDPDRINAGRALLAQAEAEATNTA
ncbi:unnamed protein product [Pseudo-nitzschia multistriata]|uniref:Tc1-like transposase DDE domain-containing protein n=1 Tax=Pseudo-nitzschia multistriata TaxID=183589 RepID=A0A448ZNT1_9STRA|nr:unnamed protein product [Pseudo-nitzschia multistriata]